MYFFLPGVVIVAFGRLDAEDLIFQRVGAASLVKDFLELSASISFSKWSLQMRIFSFKYFASFFMKSSCLVLMAHFFYLLHTVFSIHLNYSINNKERAVFKQELTLLHHWENRKTNIRIFCLLWQFVAEHQQVPFLHFFYANFSFEDISFLFWYFANNSNMLGILTPIIADNSNMLGIVRNSNLFCQVTKVVDNILIWTISSSYKYRCKIVQQYHTATLLAF